MGNLSLLFATTLIWGTVWIGIKFQLGSVVPTVSVFYRVAIAAFCLGLVCYLFGHRFRLTLRQHTLVCLMGGLLFSLNYWLFYLATARLESGLVSVIFSSIVLFNALNSRILLGRAIRIESLFGGVLGIAGIALLFNRELMMASLSEGRVVGALCALAATALVSWGNVLSAKLSSEGVPVLQATTMGMAYGALIALVVVLLRQDQFILPGNISYLLSLGYLAVICTALAFWLYLTLIKQVGADHAAFATLLFPVIALTLSTWLEGFRWNTLALVGALLVVSGTATSLFGHKFSACRVWFRSQ